VGGFGHLRWVPTRRPHQEGPKGHNAATTGSCGAAMKLIYGHPTDALHWRISVDIRRPPGTETQLATTHENAT
jgi:hypothetical protein